MSQSGCSELAFITRGRASIAARPRLLSPRPGRVNRIVATEIDRQGKTADEIRREKLFLDTVEDIWDTLKRYLDDERMEG